MSVIRTRVAIFVLYRSLMGGLLLNVEQACRRRYYCSTVRTTREITVTDEENQRTYCYGERSDPNVAPPTRRRLGTSGFFLLPSLLCLVTFIQVSFFRWFKLHAVKRMLVYTPNISEMA